MSSIVRLALRLFKYLMVTVLAIGAVLLLLFVASKIVAIVPGGEDVLKWVWTVVTSSLLLIVLLILIAILFVQMGRLRKKVVFQKTFDKKFMDAKAELEQTVDAKIPAAVKKVLEQELKRFQDVADDMKKTVEGQKTWFKDKLAAETLLRENELSRMEGIATRFTDAIRANASNIEKLVKGLGDVLLPALRNQQPLDQNGPKAPT